MYFAEFAYKGTSELADELLIQSSSEVKARDFAEEYANHLDLEVFSVSPVSDRQVKSCRLMGKMAIVESSALRAGSKVQQLQP